MNRPAFTRQMRLELIPLFCLLLLVTEFGEYQLFSHLKTEEKNFALHELASIGQLKSDQLAAFLKERRGDSLVFTDLLHIGLTQGWWNSKDKDLPALLQQPLKSVVRHYDYSSAMILDAKGNIRFHIGPSVNLSETETSLVQHVLQTAPPSFSELYAADQTAPDHLTLDTFTPIRNLDKTATVGVLILRGDWPNLFTMIQAWPVESRTAETLLIKRDNSQVVLLNALRHKTQTRLTPHRPFRIEADAPPWPTIKAAQGQYGPLESVDYRGQAVLAHILPVLGTPWSLVVKEDTEEVLAHLELLQSLAATGTLVAALGLGLWGYRWQRRREEARAQHEAQRIEHRLAAIIDSAMDGIISVDENQRIVLFNPMAERLFGCRAQEAVGQPIDRFIPHRFRDAHRSHIRTFDLSGTTTRTMGRLGAVNGLRADGKEFPIEASISQTQTDGRRLYTVILRDISERKQAEQALRVSEEQLKEAQRIALIGSWELDLTTYELFWSDEIFRIFEIDPTKFGASYEAFLRAIHPEDRAKVNAAYTSSIQTRKPYGIVHRLRMPDGRIKYVQERGQTFYDATTNKPLRSSGTVQDITELKKTEMALAQSETLFRTLATMAPVGIFRTDAAGECTYVNEPYCEISGRPPEAALGSGWAAALQPEDRARVFAEWHYTVQHRVPFSSEFRMQRPNEQTVWVFVRARAETDSSGEVLGYVGTVTDISERKQNELRTETSLHEKETLLREVHHRVKNNLQIISSLLHFQAKKAQDGHEQSIFTEGQNRLRSMILVHELLYRSTDLHRISLGEYLTMLTEQLRHSYREAACRLQLQVEADDLPVPASIALPCGMIVTELVTNAFKYAYRPGSNGPLWIRIAAGQGNFRLSVSDEGVGLPTTFDLTKASSFGLQLVTNLAEQLGATLTREPGHGTTITLEIPLPSEAMEPTRQPDNHPRLGHTAERLA